VVQSRELGKAHVILRRAERNVSLGLAECLKFPVRQCFLCREKQSPISMSIAVLRWTRLRTWLAMFRKFAASVGEYAE
jgi:hypothetical protein